MKIILTYSVFASGYALGQGEGGVALLYCGLALLTYVWAMKPRGEANGPIH